MGMWNDLQKWRKLSHTDRSVLLFAWLNIPWTAFSLKLHGFKRVHARLHTNRTHAPTTKAAADLDAALRMADSAGMTLIAQARSDRFDVFTHPHRISQEAADVA